MGHALVAQRCQKVPGSQLGHMNPGPNSCATEMGNNQTVRQCRREDAAGGMGSGSVTSRPAAAITPSTNASASASESTRAPREAFTRVAVGFIFASAAQRQSDDAFRR